MAERWARGIEDEIESGTYADRSKAARTTVLELLTDYEDKFTPRKRQHSERGRLRFLARELGHHTALELTPQVVVEYAHKRLSEGRATQTVVHELNTLSVVFRTAIALWGIALPANPVVVAREIMKPQRTLSVSNERTRRPKPGELGAILAHLVDPMPAMVCLAIETAMRRGELVAMTSEDISGATLTIPETKTDTPRTIPLSRGALEALKEMPDDGWNLRPDSITQAWGRACKKAGVVDLRWHDLRHEATSRLFEGRTFGQKLNIAEAALITGHKDVRQLMRYTQLTAQSILDGQPVQPDEQDSHQGGNGKH